jgi:hypothetical protein
MTDTASGHVTGGGHVGDVAFGFSAKRDGGVLKGDCRVADRPASVQVKCLDVTSLVVAGTHATFRGNATVNGVATTYTIDIDDIDESGAGRDTFKFVTAQYAVAGMLTLGTVQIH